MSTPITTPEGTTHEPTSANPSTADSGADILRNGDPAGVASIVLHHNRFRSPDAPSNRCPAPQRWEPSGAEHPQPPRESQRRTLAAAGVDGPQPQRLLGLFDHRQPAAAGRILTTATPRGGRFGHGHLAPALDFRAAIDFTFPKRHANHPLSFDLGSPVGVPTTTLEPDPRGTVKTAHAEPLWCCLSH